ncbi:1527_t:CDS:2, partial [Dentiscutata heterogama]
FNKANSIFPVSEADFILHEWLISYCNSMVKPPIRKSNNTINNVNAKSILDQSDTDKTDNSQDSLNINQEKNKKTVQPSIRRHNDNTNNVNNVKNTLDQSDMDEADNAQDSLDINQVKKKKVTEVKAKECALPPKKNVKWHNGNTNSINIESDYDRSDTDETNNADSFSNNNNINFEQDNIYKAAHNSNTLTTIIDIDNNSSQDELLILMKNRSKKNIQCPTWKEKKEAEGKRTFLRIKQELQGEPRK